MEPVEHLNPESLHRNPIFSQGIRVSGPHRTVYIGGQNAVTADGTILGEGDIAAQASQVAKNIECVLEAGGASVEHLIKLTIFVVEGEEKELALQAFNERWGQLVNAPIISALTVSGLAHPYFLLEVEGIAVVPE